MKRLIGLLGILTILIVVQDLNAATTGKIRGKVVDAETGDPLIGANVIIDGTDLGASTDQEGFYHIINIPVGTYSVRATYIGYQTVKKTEVRINVGLTTELKFELQAIALDMGEVIEVVAERPLVRKDVTSGRAIVSSEEIERMPVETISGILTTQAGVTEGADGQIHIRGGRSSEVAYVIDGVRVTNPAIGGQGVNVENQSIEQLEVVSGTFNAEYGQAMSGIVNIVTKDGSQQYSGSVSAYMGDYQTKHTDIFWNEPTFEPLNSRNLELSFSGPLLPIGGLRDNITFFFTHRNYHNNGYIYGINAHNPRDALYLESSDVANISEEYRSRLNFGEPFEDLNGNGTWDGGEPWFDNNLNGEYNPGVDSFNDLNLNGVLDGEYFLDYDSSGQWNNGFSGDSSRIPMSPVSRISSQAKFTWKVFPNMSLRYSLFHTESQSKGYSHNYRYNPTGDSWNYNKNSLQTLGLTQSISKDMNYTLNYSHTENSARTYHSPVTRNEDGEITSVSDEYLPNLLTKRPSSYEFYSGGMQMGFYRRENITQALKFDLTWQMNRVHQVKSGFELRYNTMKYDESQILITERYNWEPTVLSYVESLANNQYWSDPRRPQEHAAYIQDKIELDDMVMNIGIRYDYFDPDFVVPADIHTNNLTLPDNVPQDSLTYQNRLNMVPTTVKEQFSPRLGISFPITDRGIIHFAYGHFFQIPPYANLYANPDFEVQGGPVSRGGAGKILGNANLKPQKTVIYELGLQQQVSENISIDVIGYYKDIQELLSSEIYRLENQANQYTRYVNQDYGNVKGVTVSLEQRATRNFSANVDYTFQIAEGNASDPLAKYYDNLASPPIETEKKVVPLDWDRTHSLNFILSYDVPESWGSSVLGKYGSGLPYTPEYQGYRLDQENSARKPETYTVDLYLYKIIPVMGLDFTVYARVYNLLDRLNERYVYDDTGRASYSLVPTYVPDEGDQYGRHSLDNYLTRPNYYESPRQIRLGAKVSF